jgi:hypothetical protein
MIQDEIGRATRGGNGLFQGVEGGRAWMIQDEIPPENAGRTGIVGEWVAKMIQDEMAIGPRGAYTSKQKQSRERSPQWTRPFETASGICTTWSI